MTTAPGDGSTSVPIQARVEAVTAAWAATDGDPDDALVATARALVAEVLDLLELGRVRAAWPDAAAPGGWRAEPWVKAAILLAFRTPGLTEMRDGPILAARDRSTLGAIDLLDGPGIPGGHGGRSPVAHRARRHERAPRRLPGAGRGRHPAGLRERGRLGR